MWKEVKLFNRILVCIISRFQLNGFAKRELNIYIKIIRFVAISNSKEKRIKEVIKSDLFVKNP